MGLITEVLNKVQKSRKSHQNRKFEDSFELTNAAKTSPRIFIIAFIAAGAIAAVLISIVIIALDIGSTKTNQNDINNLAKSLRIQDKEINDLIAFVIKTNNLSDSQIQNLNVRLKNEFEERKNQINHLALTDNVYYNNLVKSILSNTRQISYLDGYTKSLKGDIEKISLSESSSKDLLNPASVN